MGRGAVPAAVVELHLALLDGHARAVRHFSHNLGLLAADLVLFAADATRASADTVGVHHQWAAHRPATNVIRSQQISIG